MNDKNRTPEQIVDALIGVKLFPNERDVMLELARTNRGLFERIMTLRPSISELAKFTRNSMGGQELAATLAQRARARRAAGRGEA